MWDGASLRGQRLKGFLFGRFPSLVTGSTLVGYFHFL